METPRESIYRVIQDEVARAGCRLVRVLLFGSRARGDAHPDSDWDLYVVIDRDLGFHQRNAIASKICWRLAREGIVADVFVQAEQTVRERAKDPGYLTYYVLKEGVPL